MFNKNLNVLKAKNPVLAQQLANINLYDIKDDIEVYEAESKDVIISYQGLALDDIYDPIRVAKTNWNLNVPQQTNKYDIVTIFGLGLGYLFKRAYINCECRILLYEPEINILRYVLEYVDFSDVLNDERVFVTTEKSEALAYLTEKYLSDDNLFFLYPEAYAQLCTQEMSEFTNDIVKVCNLKKMDVNTIKKLAKKWTTHTLSNLSNIKSARPLSWLKDKYVDKTALIVAAGPSLADNIQEIKENRDKFVVFSVNRAAPVLVKNGIKPDFVVFGDVNSVTDSIKDIENELKSVNIIADLRANSTVYSTFSNILIYFSKNDLIAQTINNFAENAFTLLETGGTATAQSYYAAKVMGFKKIIFAGLDLAFKENVIYADGKTVSNIDNNRISIGNSSSYTKNLVTVTDVNGNKVKTRDDYALFVRQFEEIFEFDKNSELYNISDFGAYIKGMNYKKLNDIILNSEICNIDVTSDMTMFRNDSEESWNKIYQSILLLADNEKIALNDILTKSSLLLEKEKEIILLLSQNNSDETINEKFANTSSEFAQLLPDIVKDAFLSQYFQSELLSFANMNNNASSGGTEAFVNFKNFEIQLLESVIGISKDWINFLEEKFN